ncbi:MULTISPECIES: hypothetical protein [Streptomycetaceae]|uniref:Uncharacterized protein n=1 Tax=Streptantibioticus cattleyicolor (strain ATCC 35852 / DSM 46488 / JCM 4925 / NBRC 14057 / NRRL 8057) TaxID=1003195 RepID=F8JUN2_STREN|nr:MULTISPECIES: hypothetical protein [Streptomycetaceae]AEW95666.1 hypothetical protein SCATT_32950 [Streptantibioticus cattleyicolor NRRL 8057 = DSM 46488]MYS60211.1 hypothetical protein [Streptomyces sp. SID5468]CCB76001.1 protein of unknown function [Streptantibioticus cattleyicolor NRRL 8057 = DSM 46488]
MHSDDAPSDTAHWSPLETNEWYAARNATTTLRDVLTAAGMAREFPCLRAELNAFGQGLIELGRVSPSTAERLAELLRRAIACIRDPHDTADGCGRTTD